MIQHNRPTIEPDDIEEVSKILNSGWIVQGEKVENLEKALCNYLGIDGQGVAVSSGTAALYLALFSLGVGKGDEVILPTYVCSAVLNAIFFTGATPVLVDVNLDDFNISFEKTKKKAGKRTKAIIVPHIYGVPVDIGRFLELGIPIIEDCAQSIGAKINGQTVGTFGDISIFSFYATKMLTTGQGGMAVSHKPELVEKMRDFREYDCRKEYKPRFNFQMTDIQAALGISQLKKIPSFIKRRREIAKRYVEALEKDNRNLIFQEVGKGKERVYYRFVIRLKNGVKKIQKLFEENDVQTIIPIETYELLHRYLKLNVNTFKNSGELAKTTLSIPIYPSLKEEEVLRIAQVMKKF
jgi:perosamine synthetase